MTSQNWLEDLNHKLDTWLDTWLANHPGQGTLLEEDERNQAKSAGGRHWVQLRQEAQQLRQVLLQQGEAIGLWRQRHQEALAGRNSTLAHQCADHEHRCRREGQVMWERLERIGSLRPEEWCITAAQGGWRVTEAPVSLQQAWSNFVVEQELEELRRQGGKG
ncbi:MAG: hypothetical protein TE42_01170 [Candidatus Synechococcus spongiarum SP3]|uniref:Uncharacterized protein n=1 Tax=Candidatus Synechococcus spongiarum SP3 TaxID=1604020 RepID=A0A0G2HMN6_9SYNE|nr:MAG: hypothetical protein TE42_01170 [Candidatus Synechococcus spongiarum SP3]